MIKCIKYEPTYYINIGTSVYKETIFEGSMKNVGAYTLANDVMNFDYLVVEHAGGGTDLFQQNLIYCDTIDDSKNFMVCHGNSSGNEYIKFSIKNNILTVLIQNGSEIITKIIGVKL